MDGEGQLVRPQYLWNQEMIPYVLPGIPDALRGFFISCLTSLISKQAFLVPGPRLGLPRVLLPRVCSLAYFSGKGSFL